jgi:ABC-type nitrate/sulfonate/bicarbonate transport system substrate-binding protein
VINLGFMALSDCASVVVAATQGFAQPYGLTLNLKRQASWATCATNWSAVNWTPPTACTA